MEVKRGYRKTEVGVITDEWEVKPLEDVCSMKSGEGITAAQIDQYSPYSCYGGNGIRGYTSRYTHDGSFALIGRQGALCGNVVFVTGKFFASEHAVVVTPRQGIDIQFMTYVLGEMQLNRLSEASAQPGLSVTKLLKLPVGVPQSHCEQRAIATALSDVDELLTGLTQLIVKKRDLKQAAMQQLLIGKTRLPGFSGEWEVKRLGEITDCLDNLRVPLNESQRDKMQGDYPYCGANGVLGFVDNYVIDDDIILVAEDGGYFDEYETRPIAYRMSGKCWVNNHAHILKAKQGTDQGFLYYSLVHKNILSFLASGTRAKLNKSEMNKIEVCRPQDPHEQTAIAEALSDMDAEISTLETRLEKTRALKQGMMQELLTGRIRLL
jgi:type I restriction enzyme S subunit